MLTKRRSSSVEKRTLKEKELGGRKTAGKSGTGGPRDFLDSERPGSRKSKQLHKL